MPCAALLALAARGRPRKKNSNGLPENGDCAPRPCSPRSRRPPRADGLGDVDELAAELVRRDRAWSSAARRRARARGLVDWVRACAVPDASCRQRLAVARSLVIDMEGLRGRDSRTVAASVRGLTLDGGIAVTPRILIAGPAVSSSVKRHLRVRLRPIEGHLKRRPSRLSERPIWREATARQAHSRPCAGTCDASPRLRRPFALRSASRSD